MKSIHVGGVWAWTALFSTATVVAYGSDRVKYSQTVISCDKDELHLIHSWIDAMNYTPRAIRVCI